MLRRGSRAACVVVLLALLPMLLVGCRQAAEVAVGQQAPDGFVYPLGDHASVHFPRQWRGTPLLLSFFSPG